MKLKIFGIDIFCFERKFLTYNLVSRNIKLKYRQSVLGIFWTLLIPALTTLVYYLVFQIIVRVPVQNYVLFIITGILPWGFISSSLGSGMESIFGHYSLLSKVPIPLQVFPYVEVLSNFINFLLSLPIMLIVALLTHAPLSWSLLLLFIIYPFMFIFAYGLSLLLSVAFIYLRDMRHLLAFALQIAFYLTPIIYDTDMIPERFRWLVYLNPVAPLFIATRDIWIRGQWPSANLLLSGAAWAILVFIGSTFVFSKAAKTLIEKV